MDVYSSFLILVFILLPQTTQEKQDIAEKNTGICILDEKVYHEGQQFLTKDCSLSCSCSNSKLICETSCPIVTGRCPKHHKVEFVNMQHDVEPSCKCPKKRRCIEGGQNTENWYTLSYLSSLSEDKEFLARTDSKGSNSCFVNGKEYKPGDKYITEDCQAICTCRTKFATCYPLCEQKQLDCPRGFRLSVMRQSVSIESRCSCDVQTCLEE